MESIFWLTQTASQLPDHDDWLSDEEREVLAGFRFPKRRNDWRLGRWTAKQTFRAYRSKERILLSSLQIRAANDGAPEAFYNGEPTAVSISLSHRRDRCLCAVGLPGFGVGCDLEWIEPREANFAADYFTPEELAATLEAPAGRELLETLIWSAKETGLKILRQGLSRDTRSISISLNTPVQEGSWSMWNGRCLESSLVFYGWWRTSEGFVYTIASDRPTSAPESLVL
jgi:4'-phosphopantetheinyl transferase